MMEADDSDDSALLEPVETFINWYLLCLIFSTVVLTKVLGAWSPSMCNKLSNWYVPESPALTNLRGQVSELRRQSRQINQMDNFADHARLQRKINKAEEEVQVREKAHKTQRLKVSTLLSTASTFLILVMRVSVVWYHRPIPVAIVSEELFYPLSSVLAFPTGQRGGVGGPLWAIACSQFLDTVIHFAKYTRT